MSEGADSPPPGGSPGPSSSHTEHQVRLEQRNFMVIMIWVIAYNELSVIAIYIVAECGCLFQIHYQINLTVKDWIHKSLIAGGWRPRKGKRQQGQGWGEGGHSTAGKFFFLLCIPLFLPNRLTYLLPRFSCFPPFWCHSMLQFNFFANPFWSCSPRGMPSVFWMIVGQRKLDDLDNHNLLQHMTTILYLSFPHKK